MLLAGLYVGFIGRILLKDFRDVRGDALFGKRTFLVRHGLVLHLPTQRGAVGGRHPPDHLDRPLDRYLDADLRRAGVRSTRRYWHCWPAATRPHRDELIIASIAILGRGLLLTLLARDQLTGTHWSGAVQLTLALITAGQAWSMYRHGPQTRQLTMPVGATVHDSEVSLEIVRYPSVRPPVHPGGRTVAGQAQSACGSCMVSRLRAAT